MSVVITYKGKLISNGETLNVKETTGAYNVNDVTAWGAPNALIATALTAVVKIAKRNSDGTFGTETQVDVFPSLPSDAFVSVDIPASDAGYGDVFPDGVYRIIYKVTGVNVGDPYNISSTQYKSFHPAIDCCYQKLALKATTCSCNCIDINNKLTAMTLQFALLCRAEGKGDLDAVQKYIDFITKMCTNCGCGCS